MFIPAGLVVVFQVIFIFPSSSSSSRGFPASLSSTGMEFRASQPSSRIQRWLLGPDLLPSVISVPGAGMRLPWQWDNPGWQRRGCSGSSGLWLSCSKGAFALPEPCPAFPGGCSHREYRLKAQGKPSGSVKTPGGGDGNRLTGLGMHRAFPGGIRDLGSPWGLLGDVERSVLKSCTGLEWLCPRGENAAPALLG